TLGLALAGACVGPLARWQLLPRGVEIGIDPLVVGFAFALSLVTAIGFALAPVLDASRLDLDRAIRGDVAGPQGRWGRIALRDVPVVGQVSLAFLLLVGGGLLVRSFAQAQAVRLGFEPSDVVSMTVSLPQSRYPSEERRLAFFEELARRLRTLPGVRAVGLASHLPLAGQPLRTDFSIPARYPPPATVPPAQ